MAHLIGPDRSTEVQCLRDALAARIEGVRVMSLIPLLRNAGSLPLAQLNMRATGTSEEVLEELKAMVKQGLVAVEGDHVPESIEQLQSGSELVRLTGAGTRRAFR